MVWGFQMYGVSRLDGCSAGQGLGLENLNAVSSYVQTLWFGDRVYLGGSRKVKHLEIGITCVARATCIWNLIHLDRIRQNCIYRYVPVRTGMYWYMQVQQFLSSMTWYVLACTKIMTWRFLIHAGSSSRVDVTAYSSNARDKLGWCLFSKNAKFR